MPSLLRNTFEPLLEARRLRRWPHEERRNFTNEPRKPVAEIQRDMKAWKARFGSYGYDYFEYGADIEGRNVEDFMPYELFKQYRNASNSELRGRGDFNYDCVLEDKMLFSRLAASFGYPVPETYAIVEPDRFEVGGTRAVHPSQDFADVFAGRTGILKPVVGGEGANVFLVRVDEDGITLDGERVTSEALFARLTTKYIFQELIRQHPALARLNESSVNTLRMITAQKDGRAIPLGTGVRIGRAGAHIDNWAQGGLIVNVDVEQERTRGKGIYKAGPTTEVHPDSGIALDGYALPFISEAVEVACAFHDDLYGFHSIGWDIAITESGPSIIEGNAYWSGFLMAIVPGFAPRYLETLSNLPPTPHRHQQARLINS